MTHSVLDLPDLPLEPWEDTKTTLHLFVQLLGKIRLSLMPRKNHWWNSTLYVGPQGLTTGSMPYGDGTERCEIEMNLLRHRVSVRTSRGEEDSFAVNERVSVALFHDRLFGLLAKAGIEAKIQAKPYDLPFKQPFAKLTEVAAYRPEPVERFFRVLLWVDGVFQEWSGRFYGKTCPVHLYWHHMDLTVTRFSGRKAPPLPADRSISDKDAYSHEVISVGFWAGDETVRAPAFYSYTYPSPAGLGIEPLAPASAKWTGEDESPMALLMYDDLRKEPDPRASLLEFLESVYLAGARRAGWDIEGFRVPSLKTL